MSRGKDTASFDLARLQRIRIRQQTVRWGLACQPSVSAIRGQVLDISCAGIGVVELFFAAKF